MDYNKSIFFNPPKTEKKFIQKKFSLQSKNNNDKRRSDDIYFNHFINNITDSIKDKIKNIPIKNRFSFENQNEAISTIMKENQLKIESNTRDRNYYLNLLNNIYNDSHLTNKNILNMNLKKKIEKKKTFNFSKHKASKDYSTNKNSNKKLSYCSNDIRNNISNNKTCSNDIKNKSIKSIKKLSNFSNEAIERAKKYLNEKLMKKYQSTRTISKFKKNASSNNDFKMKSSFNLKNNNENEKVDDSIKEKKDDELKIVVNRKNKKVKNNIEKEEVELEKCDTKINSNKNTPKNDLNNNNINNIPKNKNTKNIKKNRFCFFCCLTSKDDSLSDINE